MSAYLLTYVFFLPDLLKKLPSVTLTEGTELEHTRIASQLIYKYDCFALM